MNESCETFLPHLACGRDKQQLERGTARSVHPGEPLNATASLTLDL